MRFVPDAFAKVVYQILDNPWDFLHPMASFFGHYGVHIFLFLSGYGLAKKCLMSHALRVGTLYRTAFSQILKIVKLTLLGLCFYMLFYLVKDGSFPSFDVMAKYLGFLTFTENLRPGKLYYFVSVWWFLALIVQFYLVFPLLFRAMQERPTVMLGASFISLAAAALLYKPLLAVNVHVYATPLAHMPVFALGMYFAFGHTVDRTTAGLGMILIPLTFVWEEAFHLSFVLVTLAAIAFYCRYLRGLTRSSVLKFIGAISMFVYIVHGEMRWDLINWANAEQTALVIYGAFVGYLAAVLAVACICRELVVRYNFCWLGPARRS